MTLPTRLAAMSIYLVVVSSLNYHLWLIFNFISPFQTGNAQQDIVDSMLFVVVYMLLLFTVFIRAGQIYTVVNRHLVCILLVIFLVFFTVIYLHSWQSQQRLLMTAAAINIAGLLVLISEK
jgi:hypothetical protein